MVGGMLSGAVGSARAQDRTQDGDETGDEATDNFGRTEPARTAYTAFNVHAYKLTDMNDRGDVVGLPDSTLTQDSFAGLWLGSPHSDFTFQSLGAPGGTRSSTGGLNHHGHVVGMVDRPGSTRWHPILWMGRRSVLLATLGGEGGMATSINDQGDIVGASASSADSDWPTLWHRGVPQALPSLGGSQGLALRINARGMIVGYSTDLGNQHQLPVRWVRTAVQSLETLGGVAGQARGINEAGVAVGTSTDASGVERATLWQGTNPIDLGCLPGLASSAATDINDAGQIVGYSQRVFVPGDVPRATLWWEGAVLDLNNFLDARLQAEGWVLTVPRRINNAGWIACSAINTLTSQQGSFVLVRRRRNARNRR